MCLNRFSMLLPALLATALVAGCASMSPTSTYEEKLGELPVPQTEAERRKTCSHLRSEIARMDNAALYGLTQTTFPLYAAMVARKNVAAIESKAAEFKCTAAFAERQPPSEIEVCVATCKENTTRTSEQCFDACNK